MNDPRPLDGITTGYEARFDFPDYAAEPRRYILASVPRSGSTYVSHLLWQTGGLGAPLEYLNFEPSGPYGHAHDSRSAQDEIWSQVIRSRTSPNGVFAIKAFPAQLEDLGRLNPALLARAMRFLLADGPASRVVQLRRRDRTAHAISLARASLSGVWRKEQETSDAQEPVYSPAILARAGRDIALQEQAWEAMYRDMRITPLVLWFEDVLEDPARALEAVASYLDVDLTQARPVAVPRIEKQSQAGARQWRAEHAKARPED
ncbi:Stf0 family sulfotransferase [Altererythrobacter sp. CAU 1778]